jgi:beta-glucosidase
MRQFLILLFFFRFLPAQSNDQKPDYLNPDLPIEHRVDDLISRMTLEEKVSQMVNGASAIPRLQIPEYNWWNECLHGVARAGVATVFPQAIGLAATWNTDLMQHVADAISTEARAKNNEYVREGDRNIFKGLTFWSPNINIFRDPRWGRGQETYGEDPYLTSRMGVAFVKGLQGDDPKYLKVIATPKHYAVHSGPEPDRHTFNAVIQSHDLYDTYLPAFEACIKEGGAFSIMCAYNSFMGDACCGSPPLLKKILRDDWGFEGYVVSDCGAINDIYEHHKIVATAPEAAALAVKSGTDLECGRVYESSLIEAVHKGLITEDDINTAVRRLFTARFRLGMFDPPEMVPYSHIPIEENDSKEHRGLARHAADESIVLLKNSNGILPLSSSVKKIAVIGPTADSYFMLLGNYNGTPSKYVTPLQGIKDICGDSIAVTYEPGCNLVEEGIVRNTLAPEMLYTDDTSGGLTAEYFKDMNLQGKPFLTRVNQMSNANWIYGARTPAFTGAYDFGSIRWSGDISMPDSGDYNFVVKSDGRYNLLVNDQILINNWTNPQEVDSESGVSERSNHIQLRKGTLYHFVLEFSQSTPRPQLFVQYELLNVDHVQRAIEITKKSDIVIFVGGITSQLEGEEMRVDLDGFNGGDRTSLDLPKVQENLIQSLAATGTPVVLVLTSGSALSINWEKENLPAIVQLWYPGEEGGTALADVLFGNYNPAGRLPITLYKSVNQLPPFKDYNMKGRTYRYFEGEPLFPFGYGLSYSKFEYSHLAIPAGIKTGDSVTVSVEVRNAGKVGGDEVVEMYVKNLTATVPVPIRSLQGFKRIHLEPGEQQTVKFTLRPKQLSVITSDDDYTSAQFVETSGSFEISLGGEQPGSNATTTQCVSGTLAITGNPVNSH